MNKNTFVISCPIDTYSGYGSRSRDFVKALIELDKYNVKIIPQRWGSTPWGFIEDHLDEWGFLQDYILKENLTQKPDIWCQITVPNEFQPIGKYNIGLTAGIETTVCAPQWIEGCNKMDLILTSSNHSKEVFENSKFQIKKEERVFDLELNTPIKVLFEGIDPEKYKPLKSSEFKSLEIKQTLDSIPEKFAFLFVGHWMQGELGEDRKNVGLLVKAFYELYKNKSNPPALILKTSSASPSNIDKREILRRIDIIKKSIPSTNLPKVYVLHGNFSDSEMNEIYNHPKVKSMVSLTKGEGFGRPLLEFSLVNKPIITTGWSGHTDFLDKEFTALMEGSLKEVDKSAQVKDMIIENSKWFNVNHNQIAHFIKDVEKNYKKWKVKAKRQGYKSRNNFSFEKMKDLMRVLFEENIPELPKEVSLNLPKLKKAN